MCMAAAVVTTFPQIRTVTRILIIALAEAGLPTVVVLHLVIVLSAVTINFGGRAVGMGDVQARTPQLATLRTTKTTTGTAVFHPPASGRETAVILSMGFVGIAIAIKLQAKPAA